ncbi:AraC family transcriptional regulator [Streptomyces sp. MST-110588]|uniref:AraC family transcriptional regulator n=1 Tax=Streptomyces sp. MST-110588 TaxID=2833628 RepID=UPI001F5C97E6|nr:AraC family transcriptional regulator [Streptomyces sp. MST-110588]
MDALTSLLHEARARGAQITRSVLEAPWSLRFTDGAPLTLITLLRGSAWIIKESPGHGAGAGRAERAGRADHAGRREADHAGRREAVAEGSRGPLLIKPGDMAVVRGPGPYVIADDPATAPRVVIHGPDRCTTPDGRDITAEMALGPRTCGERSADSAVLLVGSYQADGDVCDRLLSALPDVLVVPDESEHCAVLDLVAAELSRDAPGQQAVLDRMLDLLLVATLREWFERPEAHAPGWYRALDDPVVGTALRLLHDDPARPWTVATLAAETGVSRASLARRFTALVGEPPIAYLTDWRMAKAADLLRRPDVTVGSVARQVGYANAFALSAAFKRLRGLSPSEHRAAVRAVRP